MRKFSFVFIVLPAIRIFLLAEPCHLHRNAFLTVRNNVSEHCYYFYSIPLNYTDARNVCESRGTHLIHLENNKEHLWIQSISQGAYYWLGIEQINGQWYWIGRDYNSVVLHKRWHLAMTMYNHVVGGQSETWIPVNSTETYSFICEEDKVKQDSGGNSKLISFKRQTNNITQVESYEKSGVNNILECSRMCKNQKCIGFKHNNRSRLCELYKSGIQADFISCSEKESTCYFKI